MRFALAFVLVAGLCAQGCAYVSPHFDPAVQKSFVRDEMRRLETARLVVYYPAHARETVLEIAGRLESCAGALQAMAHSPTPRDKLVVLITSAEFNNAYVQPRVLGNPVQMVLPLQMGSELFNFFDFGVSNVGDVACHEAVHYVQLEQIDGFWRYVNLFLGDAMSPNVGTESWFLEGLATWLEGNLGRSFGRPHSPLWTGSFASGVAARGSLGGGRLSIGDRQQYPWGGNYLTGSHFVGWLAKKYGPEKLWELVDKQGRSIFFPVGVTLRFWAVYGRTIGALLDEYEAELVPGLAGRARPEGQAVLVPDVGYLARVAASPDGALAIAWVGVDQVSTLEVREADGRVRFSQSMARLLPGRPWVVGNPAAISGMSFTGDGRHLFFFSEDVDVDGESVYAVRKFDARTGEFLQQWEGLRGLGGDVTPDGSRYIYVAIKEAVPELTALELQTGKEEVLHRFDVKTSLGAVAISPDGKRIAFSSRTGERGWDLFVREPDGQLRALTQDGAFNYGAQWRPDGSDSLVLVREEAGRSQVFSLEVRSGALTRLSQAPFAAFDPAPLPGGSVAFLNREAWHWSLDKVEPGPGPGDPVQAVQAAPELAQPAAGRPLSAESDEPYSPLDSLFFPRLRLPFVEITSDERLEVRPRFGLSLMGHDRLGFHSWALNAVYDTALSEPSVSAAYGTGLLAPWFVTASVTRELTGQNLFGGDGAQTAENVVATDRTLDVVTSLFASRSFWTTDLAVGVVGLWRRQTVALLDGSARDTARVRLIGPSASIAWAAAEGTAYAGTRRGLSASLSLTAYPRALGSDYTLGDGRLVVGGWLPLPLLKRHSFALSLRLRAVPGPVDNLLEVGGVSDVGLFGRSVGVDSPPAPTLFTPGLTFAEYLRGFEDVTFRASSVAIAGARYRYPLIIDEGITSFLWVFPSLFWRQVELEAFFEAARLDRGSPNLLAAGGGLLRTRQLWGGAPFSLYVQYAYRLQPRLGSQWFVGLSFD